MVNFEPGTRSGGEEGYYLKINSLNGHLACCNNNDIAITIFWRKCYNYVRRNDGYPTSTYRSYYLAWQVTHRERIGKFERNWYALLRDAGGEFPGPKIGPTTSKGSRSAARTRNLNDDFAEPSRKFRRSVRDRARTRGATCPVYEPKFRLFWPRFTGRMYRQKLLHFRFLF